MINFSIEEITTWNETFVRRGYRQAQANLDKRIIPYFVLPKEVFQGIPNGLFRMTGDCDKFLIGVSEEVPNEIKTHFAISEHDEFRVFGLKDLDRTLHSEQQMVETISRTDRVLLPVYANNKLVLYNHMLRESKDNLEAWRFTQEDYQGFQRAVEFLRTQ